MDCHKLQYILLYFRTYKRVRNPNKSPRQKCFNRFGFLQTFESYKSTLHVYFELLKLTDQENKCRARRLPIIY